MIDIQQNFKSIFMERGILQKNVAQRLGITEQTLSNWFTRKNDLTFLQIQRICEAADISIVDAIIYPDIYDPNSHFEVPQCEECKKKDEIIDNLNLLIKQLRQKK